MREEIASEAAALREKLTTVERRLVAVIAQRNRFWTERDALSARLKVAEEALDECEEHFDNRADADADSEGVHPNIEMRLLDVVRAALAQTKRGAA